MQRTRAHLPRGKIEVSVKDRQGNITPIDTAPSG